jgi:hypothetical protein
LPRISGRAPVVDGGLAAAMLALRFSTKLG